MTRGGNTGAAAGGAVGSEDGRQRHRAAPELSLPPPTGAARRVPARSNDLSCSRSSWSRRSPTSIWRWPTSRCRTSARPSTLRRRSSTSWPSAYSLGLAASVLYFGAIGDRYGRKLLLVIGMALSLPAALLAGVRAVRPECSWRGRVLGGLAAGMAYPTTLALITALWSGPARTKSIALWSGIGGAMSALGSLLAGSLLVHFFWGSVFLVTIPIAVAGLVLAAASSCRPTSTRRPSPSTTSAASLSIFFVAALVLAINFAPEPGMGTLALGAGRHRRSPPASPSSCGSDARGTRSTTSRSPGDGRSGWPPCAGIIVFGTLMGAMFVGPAVPAERARLLDARGRAPRSCPRPSSWWSRRRSRRGSIERVGSRVTLLAGYVFCLLGFVVMLVLWKEGIRYWPVGARLRLRRHRCRPRRHAGVALAHRLGAGAARRHGLRHRRPAARPRRRHHAVDPRRRADRRLRRGLRRGHRLRRRTARRSSQSVAGGAAEVVRQRRGGGAAVPAVRHPDHGGGQSVVPPGRRLGLRSRHLSIVLGAAIVFFFFPKKDDETRLHAEYQSADG